MGYPLLILLIKGLPWKLIFTLGCWLGYLCIGYTPFIVVLAGFLLIIIGVPDFFGERGGLKEGERSWSLFKPFFSLIVYLRRGDAVLLKVGLFEG